MPKTKIICTVGPASDSPDKIRALIQNGMNVARLNFSHGSHQSHAAVIKRIRKISAELEKPVAILQDLCGPKVRTGLVPEAGIRLETGQTLILTGRPDDQGPDKVGVSYTDLPREVKKGDRILLADGLMEIVVQKTDGSEIVCKVITGGQLTSHKGINLPTRTLSAPALTEKDRQDLLFGLKKGIDYIALSFVRSAEDVQNVKDIIQKAGAQTPVVAKIEKHEAVKKIDDILEAADGIMVARGDLGVEIPLENVPRIQKMLIRKANQLGKPVIIATQMLRSMVASPRPTRAEASDVANGVLDGTDAVMLSEETASGDYPIEAVRFMGRIAAKAEEDYDFKRYWGVMPKKDISAAVAYAACVLADQLNAAAIIATTRSGLTATTIARFRPRSKIIALCPDVAAIRRMALYWGCIPCDLHMADDTDKMIEDAASAALETGQVQAGDLVVITAGRPIWAAGTTNLLWVKQL